MKKVWNTKKMNFLNRHWLVFAVVQVFEVLLVTESKYLLVRLSGPDSNGASAQNELVQNRQRFAISQIY